MIRILFLEDDHLFGETLVDLLEEGGYNVTHFLNGQDALDATFKIKYDLYLLDINVPLIDGISLLNELREAGDMTPAIFLTSHKDKSILEKSFLSGADDFITKPFDSDELLWRITALLKRTYASVPKSIGKLTNDVQHKSISYDGKLLELSKKEYEFLSLLMEHVNNNVPKELIIDTLWSSSDGGSYGAVRVYVNRLKTLLPELAIENIRGVGYRLVC